ncbi:ATP-dependent DNA helicase [candidate division CSSED10-310 bacterium]|uniref:ATP-dependent DNA helicase n=1 Tax=candidate division CSSED10-310 bacterium TaxID=2855610 RepID=A0ABV6Z0L7_UNCC1
MMAQGNVPEKLSAVIQDIFGEAGRLSTCLPGYEYREGQCLMAEAVRLAINQKQHLMAEAGTGTGKSLAYLIPAILSEQQLVVSTVTKNLQEQLYFKDVPFIQKQLGLNFKACNLKGRANYLCWRRYHYFLQQPFFDFSDDAKLFNKVMLWVSDTKTGDRAELDFLPDNYSSWSAITSSADTCIGRKCRYRQECYFEKMKQKARNSDVIIINHHLFFADLAIKMRAQYSGMLPPIELLVLDEAHEIEDVATNYFGLRFSLWQVHRLYLDTRKELALVERTQEPIADDSLAQRVDEQARLFFNLFRAKKYREKFRLQKRAWSQNLDLAYTDLEKAIRKLIRSLQKLNQKSDEMENLITRWQKVSQEAETITALDRDDLVYWVESTARNVILAAAPIELASELSVEVFQKIPSVIMTSATLSTNQNFDFFKGRVGLAACREIIVESPFDFKKQAVLFIPRRAPDPRHSSFDEFVINAVKKTLTLTQGKAFVLFTSRRRMENTYEVLASMLPFQSFLQGEKPKHLLIQMFREDIDSVLFATSSFWHGVDVVGPSLSCVIIDKIPFSVPDEPVIEARIEFIKNRGGNAFIDFMVPSAIITLKQGIGRLIRSRTDIGVIALLDRRFIHSSYAHLFQQSMPPLTVTTDEQVLQQVALSIQQK